MPTIPGVVRAYIGLVETAVAKGREFASHPAESAVQAAGTALQLSMQAQQRYTELTIRGDEVINRLRGEPDDAPDWATFDEPPPTGPTARPAPAESVDPSELLDEDLTEDALEPLDVLAVEEAVIALRPPPAKKAAHQAAPAKKAAAKKAAPEKKTAPAKKIAARNAAPEKSAPAKKVAPAKKAAAKKVAPAKKAAPATIADPIAVDPTVSDLG